MKIGLIVDRDRVARWQADALRTIAEEAEVLVYNCTNASAPPRRLRHAPYYALNLLSLRGPLTARTPLPDSLRIAGRTDFECAHDGNWQSLPQSLLDRIERDRPDAIVKFGMGLLRVPEALGRPILSYHHGDPRRFRGRPAGFYELLAGCSTVGQMVHILSNKLDAGVVVAFAETKANPTSWRRTMTEAYRTSPLLLRQAIGNALAGRSLPIDPVGRNYRLPSAATVVRFVLGRIAATAGRIAYGAFYEKAWQVAEAPLADDALPTDAFPAAERWRTLPKPRRYRFLADPFYHPAGGILAEALRTDTGRGEIVHIIDDAALPVLAGEGHLSYPATLAGTAGAMLVPEMSEWSAPRLFRLTADGAQPLGELKLPGRPRLLDPTPFEKDGTVYLFGNDAADGAGVLRLWMSDRLDGEFVEHPASPILISPAGARMAGGIFERDGALYRPGQDFRGQYGDGVILFRIEKLSPSAYAESAAGTVNFVGTRGPHTLNLGPGTVLFDYYRDRFAPLAGWRRLRAFLSPTADTAGRGSNVRRARQS